MLEENDIRRKCESEHPTASREIRIMGGYRPTCSEVWEVRRMDEVDKVQEEDETRGGRINKAFRSQPQKLNEKKQGCLRGI